MRRLRKFAGGAFQNTPLQSDENDDKHQVEHRLGAIKNPRTNSIMQAKPTAVHTAGQNNGGESYHGVAHLPPPPK
jgi:hypothetical protein